MLISFIMNLPATRLSCERLSIVHGQTIIGGGTIRYYRYRIRMRIWENTIQRIGFRVYGDLFVKFLWVGQGFHYRFIWWRIAVTNIRGRHVVKEFASYAWYHFLLTLSDDWHSLNKINLKERYKNKQLLMHFQFVSGAYFILYSRLLKQFNISLSLLTVALFSIIFIKILTLHLKYIFTDTRNETHFKCLPWNRHRLATTQVLHGVIRRDKR